MTQRSLKTVSQFASGSVWTESQLRWMIHCGKENGLIDSGALVRCGRRVFIDEAGFDSWLVSQNPHLKAAQPRALA